MANKYVTDPELLKQLNSSPYVSDPELLAQLNAPEAVPESAGILRRAGDIGISALQGVVGLPEVVTGLADIPTMGLAGKGVEKAEEAIFGGTTKDVRAKLQALKSEEQQASERRVSETFAEEGIGAGLKEALTSPGVILGTVAESAPSMIGGAGIARKALSMAPKIGAIKAAAMGEGAVSAGQIAESVRQNSESGLLTPTQAAASTLAGALTAGLGVVGGKAAAKLGVGDIDVLLAGGATKLEKQSILTAALKGAISESVFEELPQSLQEQALQNIAEGKPWDDGLAEAGAMGAIAGGLLGGGASTVSQASANRELAAKASLKEPEKEIEKQKEISKEKVKKEPSLADEEDLLGASKISQEPSEAKKEPMYEFTPSVTSPTYESGIGAGPTVSGESQYGVTAIPTAINGVGLAGSTSGAGTVEGGTETKSAPLTEKTIEPKVETKPIVPPTIDKPTVEHTTGLKIAEDVEAQKKQLEQLEKTRGKNKNISKVAELGSEIKEVKPEAKFLTHDELNNYLKESSNGRVSISKESYDALHPYLKTVSSYGIAAPVTMSRAIQNASAETILSDEDIKNQKEYKAELVEIKNQEEAKRLAERQAKIDELVAQGKTVDQARNEVGGEKKYKLSTNKPLDFMTKEELNALQQKHLGTEISENLKNEIATRDDFINSLSEKDKAKFDEQLESDRTMDKLRLRERVRGENKQKSLNKTAARQEAENIAATEDLVDRTARLSPKDVKTKLTETEGSIREQERKKVNQKVKDVLPAEGKGSLKDILKTLAMSDEFKRSFGYQTLAAKLLDRINSLINNKAATTKITEATIQYGEVPKGRPAMYDPKTSTITISNDPAATEGMHLGQIIAHETMHYMLDHIIDNRNAPGFLSQHQKDSLDKLEAIRKQVAKVLGKQFDIPNLKEFIAESFSNSDFQRALAELRVKPGGAYNVFKDTVHKMAKAIMGAIGLGGMKPVILQDTLGLIEDILTDTQYRLPGDMQGKVVSFAPKKAEKEGKKFNRAERKERLNVREYHKPTTTEVVKKALYGEKALKGLAKKYQNDRYPIKSWQKYLARAGRLIVGGKNFNNIHDLIVLSAGEADLRYKEYLENKFIELRSLIGQYAKTAGIQVSEALGDLHELAEALHEPERRHIKYLQQVPLNNDRVLKLKSGTEVSPADLRNAIFKKINSQTRLTDKEIQAYRTELENLVAEYKEDNGTSPGGYKTTNEKSSEYNVTADLDSTEVQKILDHYDPTKNKQMAVLRPQLDKILATLKPIQETTILLNKMGNYWSNSTDNIKRFYGWENYIPLKGAKNAESKLPANSAHLNLDDARLSTELKEEKNSFEGRKSEAENPIIQTMVDASLAAARAGRKDVPQAVANALSQGLIEGSKKPIAVYTPEQIYSKEGIDEDMLHKRNVIFNYKEDGSMEVWEIKDPELLESIRRSYKESNPLIDKINTVTSTIGQTHTRYNPAFPVLNYVRDALTNAFNIAIDRSPTEAFKYIGAVSTQVANGGLYKTLKVSHYFHNAQIGKIRDMAKKDPYIKNLLEYLEEGGRVSYLQGLSIRSNLDRLYKDLGRHKIIQTKEQMDKFFDTYTDMFELSSRAAAYGVIKGDLKAEGKTEEQARTMAASFAKQLANFEEVGEHGRALGAMFMFFRPSATGAVRAIESIAPAFRTWKSAKASLPPHMFGTEGNRTAEQQKALDTYEANWKKQSRAATVAMMGLLGAGATMYLMAAGAADDDDEGRNVITEDDLARWTRFARFDIGDGKVIQIPWGFGQGAFAAAGAQVMGAMMSQSNSVGDVASNLANIGLDSFLPLPISKISLYDNPMAFVVDSVMPSLIKPFVEFQMNLNTFGQEIYNNRQTRYGDAYTGGDSIPEMFKDASRFLADSTNGGVDWSPNSMYFFANNYADGLSRLLQNSYGLGLLMTGQKEADITQNAFVLQSFFSRLSNVDQREFSKIQSDVTDIQKKVNMFKKSNPDQYVKYLEANPYDESKIEVYNKLVGGDLKKLQEEANIIRQLSDITAQERTDLLKDNRASQNLIKYNIIQTMKMFDELESN